MEATKTSMKPKQGKMSLAQRKELLQEAASHEHDDGRHWLCFQSCARETAAQVYGSVVPRCLLRAMLGAAEGVVFKWLSDEYPNSWFGVFRHHAEGGSWYHPYSLNMFGMMLGWALVMRIQIAYQRYWEGATHCHMGGARWADAVMQVMAFDEASKDAFSDAALEFRMLITQ